MKVASVDVDEAREVGGAIYHPHRVRHISDDRSFGMEIAGQHVGSVMAGSLTYAAPMELTTDELDSAYQVNLALQGTFETTRGDQHTQLTTTSAAVYGPGDRTSILGWGNGDRLIAIKLDRGAVEGAAAEMFRRPTLRDADLDFRLDLTTPEAVDWLTLVQLAMRPGGLASTPTAAASIGDAIIAGFLSIAHHPELVHRPSSGRPARAVEQAVDFIDLNADRQLTVTEVAAEVGVCTRQLQQLFVDTVAQTPSDVIRAARLRRVRQALIAADPSVSTVASVASAHDYAHLGRFSVLYKKHFGEAPSQTLRR